MSQQVKVVIRTKDPVQMRRLIVEQRLDVNCGGPRCIDGEWQIEAYCDTRQVDALRGKQVRVEIDEHFERDLLARRAEVGAGNRYANRTAIPRGVGRKEP